jgi:hypothetical protein
VDPSSSLTSAADFPNPTTTDLSNSVSGGGAASPCHIVQVDGETTQTTAVTLSSSHAANLPIESDTPVRSVEDSQMKVSRTLDRAEEAMNMMKTWENAVAIIKRVMDAVSSIAEVCPMSRSFHTSPG